jgi:hypothetical protein
MPSADLLNFMATATPAGLVMLWLVMREMNKTTPKSDPVKELTEAMSELRNRVADQATEIAVIRAILDRMEKRDKE